MQRDNRRTAGLYFAEEWLFRTVLLNTLEALQMSLSEAPDLLAADGKRPQLCGIDRAIRTREQCSWVRSCSFPPRQEPLICSKVLGSKATTFHLLSKPIHPNDLLRRIYAQTALPPPEDETGFLELLQPKLPSIKSTVCSTPQQTIQSIKSGRAINL